MHKRTHTWDQEHTLRHRMRTLGLGGVGVASPSGSPWHLHRATWIAAITTWPGCCFLLATQFQVRPTPSLHQDLATICHRSPSFSSKKKKSPRKAQAGQLDTSLNSIRPQSAGSMSGISRRGSVATLGSPRLTTPRSVLRDGVIFHSSNREVQDSSIGPGYYAPLSSSFVVKSFNARVKSSIKKSAAQASSPSAAAAGSPSSRSPSSQRQQTLTVFPFDSY